jgi:phosphatidylserine/phosphatidylglycerophosphate/cardiolipin synthase-like enzyme
VSIFQNRGLALLLLAAAFAVLVGCSWYLSRVERVVDVGPVAGPPVGAVHFGGPDMPAGTLRQLLLRKVRSAPPRSRIRWATYYFLDHDLAVALTAASDRGVDVTLVVEGDPRFDGANEPVLSLLRQHGLGGGLRVRAGGWLPRGKLHAKIYVFSRPAPVALVGSFNPSGGPRADPAVLSDIGDQDRGHNLLVEITSPGLVAALGAHVDRMARSTGSWARKFSAAQNRIYRDGHTQLYFFPRVRTSIVDEDVRRLGKGDRVWAAVSHLDDTAVSSFASAARRGAKVELIVHHTERRVPEDVLAKLAKAGVTVRRYVHPARLPMHAKFFLIEKGGTRIAYFGSFNFNRASRAANDELLVRSTDPALFKTLLDRFHQIERERLSLR